MIWWSFFFDDFFHVVYFFFTYYCLLLFGDGWMLSPYFFATVPYLSAVQLSFRSGLGETYPTKTCETWCQTWTKNHIFQALLAHARAAAKQTSREGRLLVPWMRNWRLRKSYRTGGMLEPGPCHKLESPSCWVLGFKLPKKIKKVKIRDEDESVEWFGGCTC